MEKILNTIESDLLGHLEGHFLGLQIEISL